MEKFYKMEKDIKIEKNQQNCTNKTGTENIVHEPNLYIVSSLSFIVRMKLINSN